MIAIKCEILVVGSCAKYVQAPLLRIQSKQLVYQVAGKGILSWRISVYTLENAEYGLHNDVIISTLKTREKNLPWRKVGAFPSPSSCSPWACPACRRGPTWTRRARPEQNNSINRVFFILVCPKMTKCQITCKSRQKSSICQNFLGVWHLVIFRAD